MKSAIFNDSTPKVNEILGSLQNIRIGGHAPGVRSEGTMMEFAERLRAELSGLLDVIHRTGRGVVIEEFPGALEEDTSNAEPLDGKSPAARRALIEEANRRAETLERLRRGEDSLAPRMVGGRSRQKPGPSSLLTRPL